LKAWTILESLLLIPPAKVIHRRPEDGVPFDTPPNAVSAASAASSDTANVTMFSRLLAPPAPVFSAAAQRGEQVFATVGCQACHTATQTTGGTLALGSRSC
jgi:mono/diheme cytochrome c family protein